MKLYATITSERATKGQGGNKYLDIEIQAEQVEDIPTRANIYRLKLEIEDNRLYATLHDYSNGTDQNLITYRSSPKVKRQKGELCPSGHKQDADGRCKCTNSDSD